MAPQSIVFLFSSFFLFQILNPTVYGVVDICFEPVDYGGVAPHEEIRFSYDTNAEACVEFTWTGCGGNYNNFITQSLCEETCSGVTEDKLNYSFTCSKIQDVGGPEGIEQPRYYYNRDTDACEQFTYNGCGGNYNNFENKKDCEVFCSVEDKSVDPRKI